MVQNPMNNLNDIFWGQHSADRPYEELLEEVQTYISDNHAKTISAGDSAELINCMFMMFCILLIYGVVLVTQVVDSIGILF